MFRQRCCSLMHGRLFALSPTVTRAKIKRLPINHIQIAGFCSNGDNEGATLLSSLFDSSNDSQSGSSNVPANGNIVNATEYAVLGAFASTLTNRSQSQLRTEIDGVFRDRNRSEERRVGKECSS